MLAGHLRTLSVAAVFVFIGTAVLIPDASAHPRHARHHRGRGHGLVIFPSIAIGIAPGAAPAVGVGVAVGVGRRFGFGYAPFSLGVGVSLPGPAMDPRGSLRTEVPQKDTEVFVDGYYAGRVDDFDGSFQKLRLDPGPHTVTLYLDGYRPYEESINSTLGTTVKIRHEMEPLAPGEPVPMRPSPGSPPYAATAPAPTTTPPSAPAAPRVIATTPSASAAEYGVLSVRAQPADAEIWIDGELWELPPSAERLSVHLPAGPHTLQLSKEGYEDFEIDVEVQPGETEALNVRMTPSP